MADPEDWALSDFQVADYVEIRNLVRNFHMNGWVTQITPTWLLVRISGSGNLRGFEPNGVWGITKVPWEHLGYKIPTVYTTFPGNLIGKVATFTKGLGLEEMTVVGVVTHVEHEWTAGSPLDCKIKLRNNNTITTIDLADGWILRHAKDEEWRTMNILSMVEVGDKIKMGHTTNYSLIVGEVVAKGPHSMEVRLDGSTERYTFRVETMHEWVITHTVQPERHKHGLSTRMGNLERRVEALESPPSHDAAYALVLKDDVAEVLRRLGIYSHRDPNIYVAPIDRLEQAIL